MRSFGVLVVFAILSLIRSAPADACTCRAPGPPCETVFIATVFVGKVTKVVSKAQSAVTTFEVLDTLHSDVPLGKTITIEHGTIGSMCGTSFAQGTTYVVYAGGTAPDKLGVFACSLTHVWTKNDPDVLFAHTTSTRKTALIEGTVVLTNGESSYPKPGVELHAAGTSFAAKSGANGAFKIEVPPGTYTLEVASPGLRAWQGQSVWVTLPVPAACAHPAVSVVYDGRIEGTVTDPAGKPVRGIEVGAIAVRERDRSWRMSAKSDAQGHYLIHEVPAGSFLVGVSLLDYGGSDPQSPWPTTYYPGTPDLKKAKSIATTQSGLVGTIDFAVPAPAKVVTFRGTVVRSDGSLSVGTSVTIIPAGRNRSTSAMTDVKGVYTLTELAGEDVVIRACDAGGSNPQCAEHKRKVTGDAVIDFRLP
jgi:hypothetical protein